MPLTAAGARRDVPLGELTHYGIGGRAEWFAEPVDVESTARLVRDATGAGLPVRVFGGGSNLLVGDGVLPGLTIRLDRRRFGGRQVPATDRVVVGAGLATSQLARHAAEGGWQEALSFGGIPGAVGGALAMNAGTAEGAIGDCVESVLSLSPTGAPELWSREDCSFAYRNSRLKGRIILGASFRFTDRGDGVVDRLAEWIRHKSAIQPYDVRSAGCMFRNPDEITAGRLIDELGLKGRRSGGVEVSTRHANFLVNTGGGTCADARALMAEIRDAARDRRGIELHDEIVFWPTDTEA